MRIGSRIRAMSLGGRPSGLGFFYSRDEVADEAGVSVGDTRSRGITSQSIWSRRAASTGDAPLIAHWKGCSQVANGFLLLAPPDSDAAGMCNRLRIKGIRWWLRGNLAFCGHVSRFLLRE